MAHGAPQSQKPPLALARSAVEALERTMIRPAPPTALQEIETVWDRVMVKRFVSAVDRATRVSSLSRHAPEYLLVSRQCAPAAAPADRQYGPRRQARMRSKRTSVLAGLQNVGSPS